MKIKQIEVRLPLLEISEQGLLGSAEIDVNFRFFGPPEEAERLSRLLQSGGSFPPREFWDAIDWGQVDPPVAEKPLTGREASDIRLAEAQADPRDRIQVLFAACMTIVAKRRSRLEEKNALLGG